MSQARLLVVDDNLMNRDALSRQLQRSGFEVMAVANGMEAISLIEEGGYALILLDVNMPGMDGIEVLRWIRKSYTLNQLPVIMVTARDQSQEMVEAFEEGANDYVVKPIDFPVLLARITSHLATRKTQAPPTSTPDSQIIAVPPPIRTRPAHQVFICHSNKDTLITDRLVSALEAAQMRCWIAPRNLPSGDTWPTSTIDAISSAKLIVVIYSKQSRMSKQMLREINKAADHDIPILPLRVDTTPVTEAMEYFINSSHWVDVAEGFEFHIPTIVEMARKWLTDQGSPPGQGSAQLSSRPDRPDRPR